MEEKTFLEVLKIYQERQISLGKAAEMMGIRKRELIRELAQRGIPYFDYVPEELEPESREGGRALKRWDQRKEFYAETEDPAVDAFLEEIAAVCRKHGLVISHEEPHGSFLVVRGPLGPEIPAYSGGPTAPANIAPTLAVR